MGNCRAIISSCQGKEITQITEDHTPASLKEYHRIIKNGGKVYRQIAKQQPRIFPGRLLFSRSIGNIEAKLPVFNGNPKVLIATPSIYEIKIRSDHDFLLLGSDGIFEKCTNKEVVSCIYSSYKESCSITDNCGIAVDSVIKLGAFKKSLENLTCVMIAFSNYNATQEINKAPKETYHMGINATPRTVRSGKDKAVLMKILMSNEKSAEHLH